MMNRSAGVPKRAAGSASSAGGTWPCGQTSGRSLTEAYSARATVRWAGSESKQRSGESAQGVISIVALLIANDAPQPCLRSGAGAAGSRPPGWPRRLPPGSLKSSVDRDITRLESFATSILHRTSYAGYRRYEPARVGRVGLLDNRSPQLAGGGEMIGWVVDVIGR